MNTMIEQFLLYYLCIGVVVSIPLTLLECVLLSVHIKVTYLDILKLYFVSVLFYPYIIIQLFRI